MTKRTKGSMWKKNQLKVKVVDKAGENVTDRISELADDILISIISRLTLKEATATSVLSTRWRPLHTCVSRLNFPPFYSLDYAIGKIAEAERKFPKYIKMINRTLDSYKGGLMLKEFRVHMCCMEGANMKRWLKFALSKQVEIIDISITYPNSKLDYLFQLEKLIKSGLVCLRELSLSMVEVVDREIKLLLSNSPNLESLSLQHPRKLRNVSIVGHPKLKHFNIAHTCSLESIEIEDMINLVSLRFYRLDLSHTCVIRFNNLPKLIKLDTNKESFRTTFWQVLIDLPSCVQSERLLVRLLNSGLYARIPSRWFMSWTKLRVRDIYKYDFMKELSLNLKKVELSEYLGSPEELEFAVFFASKAPALQELIVEPRANTKRC